jgi:phospholipid/cholesterol/gamma-HCH transport system substrate-binding protein
MITQRTKVQLAIFLAITLFGVSFVGAKYAQLDRLVLDDSYDVTAHFADSGGIFAGAEVTYRGTTIGRVSALKLTDKGVDVDLAIDNGEDRIPSKTEAVVGNRSAVGEQYVDLQPLTNDGPFLKQGSQIAQSDTQIPIQTTTFLDNTNRLVNSVPKQDLNTVVSEFGQAFKGGGTDLGRLIDSSDSFITAASDNLDITRQLLKDSNVVLSTQIDKTSAIQSFARDLANFSDTLASSDGDLRKVIANGSATATELRTFLQQNDVNLGKLINNLVTTGEVQIRHLPGIRMLLILYPYVVAGGFTVVDKSEGDWYAHFGMVLQQNGEVCTRGYNAKVREPTGRENTKDIPMDFNARCAEPASAGNPRGAQNSPRVAPFAQAGQAGIDAPVIGSWSRGKGFSYDESGRTPQVVYTGGSAAQYGDKSWMQLLFQPVLP